MMKNYKKGFTLIELLVVIAIIGILASIILASLGTARSKGNDSKVKEQLNSVKNAAEIYYATNNSYGPTEANACAAGMFGDTASGMASLTNFNNYPSGTTLICNSTATSPGAYAVQASLSSGYWCVDSTGMSTSSTATLGTATHC